MGFGLRREELSLCEADSSALSCSRCKSSNVIACIIGSSLAAKVSSAAFWNSNLCRTSNLGKSHCAFLPLPGACSPLTHGQMKDGQSFSHVC